MSRSSRGLGHRPFTATTGVRLPYGTPYKTRTCRDVSPFFVFVRKWYGKQLRNRAASERQWTQQYSTDWNSLKRRRLPQSGRMGNTLTNASFRGIAPRTDRQHISEIGGRIAASRSSSANSARRPTEGGRGVNRGTPHLGPIPRYFLNVGTPSTPSALFKKKFFLQTPTRHAMPRCSIPAWH
jgi:hypothetical protein